MLPIYTITILLHGCIPHVDKDTKEEEPNAIVEGSFLQVSAGGAHSCGLDKERSVHCWGIEDASLMDFGQVTETPTGIWDA